MTIKYSDNEIPLLKQDIENSPDGELVQLNGVECYKYKAVDDCNNPNNSIYQFEVVSESFDADINDVGFDLDDLNDPYPPDDPNPAQTKEDLVELLFPNGQIFGEPSSFVCNNDNGNYLASFFAIFKKLNSIHC